MLAGRFIFEYAASLIRLVALFGSYGAVLFLFACSTESRIVEERISAPHTFAKFKFTAMARGKSFALLGISDARGSYLEFKPFVFEKIANRYWVAGAFLFGELPYRSFLFSSADGVQWREEVPANEELAIVAIAPTQKNGLALVESYWIEGSSIAGVWHSNSHLRDWKNIETLREIDWKKDSIRSHLNCCTENVIYFSAKNKNWILEIEGESKVARFDSKNFGRTWVVQKKSIRKIKTNLLIEQRWKKIEWKGNDSWLELQFDGKSFFFPAYWRIQPEGKGIVLEPGNILRI